MKKEPHTITIGEACNLMTGGTPSKSHSEYFEGGTIPWLVSGDIHKKEIFDCEGRITESGHTNSSTRYLPVNSVMIALNGQGKTRGTVALLRIKAMCNQSLVSIYPKDINQLSPEYLYRVLDGRYDELRKMTGDAGNERRGLNMPLIRSIRIALPSLSEQKRIVKILDEKFETIEELKKIAKEQLASAKELFESKLKSVFEDPTYSQIYLADVCKVERGSSPRPIVNYITDDDQGINWIKIGDTKNINRYLYKTRQKITREGAEQSRYVNENDLILSNSMSFGKPYIMKTSGCIHDGWFVLRPNKDLDTEFFYYSISSRNVQDQMSKLATGAVVKNISGDLVKKVLLALPDLKEQKQVVKELDELSKKTKELEMIFQRKIIELEELKKSYLYEAFSGNL